MAPLGLAIHSGTNVPKGYRGAVFIAEHGPGNRSGTIGYRVSVVRLADDHRTALGYSAFAQGWYGNGRAWGRPADILEARDGSLIGLRRPGRENLPDPLLGQVGYPCAEDLGACAVGKLTTICSGIRSFFTTTYGV